MQTPREEGRIEQNKVKKTRQKKQMQLQFRHLLKNTEFETRFSIRLKASNLKLLKNVSNTLFFKIRHKGIISKTRTASRNDYYEIIEFFLTIR